MLKSHLNATDPEENVLKIGAGSLSVLSALGANVALDPASDRFGAVPAGSGQTRTATVRIETRHGSGSLSMNVAPASGGGGGVFFSASQPDAAGNVTVTMTASKGATAGNKQARLVVSRGGAEVAHAVLYALVK